MFGLRHQMTTSGIRRAELLADTAYFYDQGNRLELRRVHVTFFTAAGAKDAVLTGRRGTYDVRAQKLVGRGNVLVVSEDGRRLASPHLVYDRAANQVSSDSAFTFNEPGRRLEGVGFQSDPALRNLTVLRGARGETRLQAGAGARPGVRP
jgi:LPS export ABC transporter protein LptC